MNRIPTGIMGMDELIEGGYPENRSMLVVGACGTGKTIFSMQFIYNGVMKYKEPGIYVTLDERPDLIKEDVLRFGWDLKKLEEKKWLKIIDGTTAKSGINEGNKEFDLEELGHEIIKEVNAIGAKRLVIDSIPALGFNYNNVNDIRKAILRLSYLLQRTGVTTVFTSEIQEGAHKYGKYGVEEYVADGVIVLHYMGIGTQSNRTMHIRKMRGTKHSEDLHPITITKNGIEIHKLEEVYEKT
ncbi:MAG TPA: ATPase domain-containing protein [archaeon]|nr:ATPase domain-containing protein [archaeon]